LLWLAWTIRGVPGTVLGRNAFSTVGWAASAWRQEFLLGFTQGLPNSSYGRRWRSDDRYAAQKDSDKDEAACRLTGTASPTPAGAAALFSASCSFIRAILARGVGNQEEENERGRDRRAEEDQSDCHRAFVPVRVRYAIPVLPTPPVQARGSRSSVGVRRCRDARGRRRLIHQRDQASVQGEHGPGRLPFLGMSVNIGCGVRRVHAQGAQKAGRAAVLAARRREEISGEEPGILQVYPTCIR